MKKERQNSGRNAVRFAMALTLAAAGLMAVPAMAQAGPFGRGGKGCRSGRKGGKGKGMGKLMFGDLKRLQKRLKLTPHQVGQIKRLRSANKGKRAKVRLQMARIHAKMRVEWLANKPSVWKLKKLHMRKLKLKSKMANHRFQIRLKVALILTPSQRMKLKHGGRGFGRRFGRRGGRGFGRGHGRHGWRGGKRGGRRFGKRGKRGKRGKI